MTRISTNQFFDTNLYGMQLAGTRMLRAQSPFVKRVVREQKRGTHVANILNLS